MENIFPRVLIIGYPFDRTTGGGITMSNLFTGWPKERLALASNVNLQNNPDMTVCNQLYQLGYKEKLHPFPINFILPKVKMGPVSPTVSDNGFSSSRKAVPGKYKPLYKLLTFILNFLGVYNSLYKLRITPEFKQWIEVFSPDVIYSQLSTLELIRFVAELQKLTGKPLVIHMMDDWPMTINKPGLFWFYWKRIIEKEFRQLINIASVLLSICDAMSEEYKLRYKKDFIPFHNPIDTATWLPDSKRDWEVIGEFTILYAGKIGTGVESSIKDIALSVEELIAEKPDIIFEIQTNDISALKKIVKFNKYIKWAKPIEYRDLPRKFSGADILVLPYDFDSESIDFLRYSFPTKVSEYMISGTPILIYADKQTALVKYAHREQFAYVVSEKSIVELKKAIFELYSDVSLRKEFGERARNLCLQKEDSKIVRERFRECFVLCSESDKTINGQL